MRKLKDLINDNLDVSLSKFAEAIGVSRPTIYNIINDTMKHKPSAYIVKRICKYFNVDYKEYL